MRKAASISSIARENNKQISVGFLRNNNDTYMHLSSLENGIPLRELFTPEGGHPSTKILCGTACSSYC